MDQAWIDAARAYNSMDERGRHAYWSQLTPEQQAALTEALAATAASTASAGRTTASASAGTAAPARRSFLGTFAIGCTGIILGVILTVAFEIAAIASGVGAIADMLGPGPSRHTVYETPTPEPSPYETATPEPDHQLDCRSPRNAFERSECARQRFRERKEDWESRHSGEPYPCEEPPAE